MFSDNNKQESLKKQIGPCLKYYQLNELSYVHIILDRSLADHERNSHHT